MKQGRFKKRKNAYFFRALCIYILIALPVHAQTPCFPGYGFNPGTNRCEADLKCPGGSYDDSMKACTADPLYQCLSGSYSLNLGEFRCETDAGCPCGGSLDGVNCLAGPPPCNCDYQVFYPYGEPECGIVPICPDNGHFIGGDPPLCIMQIDPDYCPEGYLYSHGLRLCSMMPVCPQNGYYYAVFDKCLSFFPCGSEVCDDLTDNDCDGQTDEGCACEDIDNDGITTCNNDCDDNNASINSSMVETCDGMDNNCDGAVDDTCFGEDALCGQQSNRTPVGSSAHFATGNLYHNQDIIRFHGAGASVHITVHYNSRDTEQGPLGQGWSHTYNLSITDKGDTILYKGEEGQRVYFYSNGNGTYTPVASSGIHSTITKHGDNTYTLTKRSGITYEYDTQGKLTIIRDRNSNTVTFTYTGIDLTSITDASGRVINLTYNANRITSVTDPAGRTTTFAYTGDNLNTITGPITDTWTFTYDDSGRMLTKTNPLGAATTYTYDAHGMLATSTDSENNRKSISYNQPLHTATVTEKNGAQWTFVYDDVMNALVQATDPNSNITVYAYDSDRNLTATTWADGRTASAAFDTEGNRKQHLNAEGRLTRYTYNSYGQMLTKVSPNNVSSKYTYDAAGNLIKKELISPAGTVLTAVTYTYGAKGERLSATDANNNTTTFTYDLYGNIASVINALDQTTAFTYDIMGNLLAVTGPNSTAVFFEYDLKDRPVKVTGPGDEAVYYEYDAAGNTTSIIDQRGNVTAFEYDSMNRQTKIIDPEAQSVNYTYDAEGNVSSISVKDSADTVRTSATYSYDLLNRLVRRTHPDSTYTELSYDMHGNILSERDENSNITTFTYDGMNRIQSRTDAGNGVTSFTYDSRGNLLTVTDANSNTTAYTYDYLGQLIAKESPNRGSTDYAYDTNGNMTGKTDGNSTTITYEYDTLNRLTSVQFPDGAQNLTYTYDDPQHQNSIGRLTSMSDPSGISAYDYDKHGRIILETRRMNDLDYRTAYEYDAKGNLTRMIYPGGRNITYTYNRGDNALSIASTFYGATHSLSNNITYLPFGGVTSMTHGNGVTTDMTYDTRYTMSGLTVGGLKQLAYTRDNKGNITDVTDSLTPGDTQFYTYDPVYGLTAASGPWGALTYAYDAVGNRTDETTDTGSTAFNYRTGTDHLLSATGDKMMTFAYDSAGNVTSENTTQFIYNLRQRLVLVMEDGNVISEYVYDGIGQRVKKMTQNGIQCKLYHYSKDGLLIAESSGSGNITAEYVYLNGIPAAKIEGNIIYYYHNNHLGTPMVMTDASGQTVWEGAYLPFGETYSVTGTITNNLRFPGQYYDEETGLHYNYFRDYHPSIGRYIESDPIGLRGGVNLYAYAEGNPVNRVDPTGLLAPHWHFGISLSAGIYGGYGFKESISFALESVMHDFVSGSQGQGTHAAVSHAMRGKKINGSLQSRSEARKSYQLYIDAALSTKYIGGALHGAEDEFAKGHQFQPWTGFELDKKSFWHLFYDFFPTFQDVSSALNKDMLILNQYKIGRKDCD